jgi:hypothetical protein
MTRLVRPLSIPLVCVLLLALSGAAGGGEGGCDPPDDAAPAVSVDPEGPLVTSESGLSATFTVALTSPPAEPVEVIARSGDVGEWTVGEAPGEVDLATADSLALVDVLTLTYPHGPGAITQANGVHNQGYHFDGAWHFSVGTDTEHRGWAFVNHADGSLKCASTLADPFEGPDPAATGDVHPGGGWFHDGRFYTVVANQVEVGEGGGFGVASFAPGTCDAANAPDAMTCACDVSWTTDVDGQPQVWASDDYKGFGLGLADEARLYDIYGSSAWTCSLAGEGCTDADPATGPAGFWSACVTSDRVCPQECVNTGDHVVCTPFPGGSDLGVYPTDAAGIAEFQGPIHEIALPAELDLQGTPGQPSPEGIALQGGQLYMAGDHPPDAAGDCGSFVVPCTDGSGDQVVRVYRLVRDGQELTFTAANWNQPQEVQVVGVDDAVLDGDVSGEVLLTFISEDDAWAEIAPVAVSVVNVDNDAPPGPLAPQHLSPPHGSELGGQLVRVEGTGLVGLSEVWFGDVQATLGAVYEVQADVLSPAGSPGTVDVRLVRTDGQEEILPGAWTWHPDHTGLFSGLARSLLVAYDPAHFWIGSPYGDISQPYVQLDGLFHEPIEEASTLFGATAFPGDCSDPGGAAWTTVAPGPPLSASSGALGQVDVPDGGGDGVYRLLVNDVDVWDWSGDVMDLEIVDHVGALPAQPIDGVIWMPEIPDFGPYTWTSGNSWTWGEDLALSWTTLGAPADAVRWRVMPAHDVTPLNSFGCTMQGAGPLVVPWSDIVDGVDLGQLDSLLLSLSFWTGSTPTLEHDGSSFWGRGYVDLYFYFALQ